MATCETLPYREGFPVYLPLKSASKVLITVNSSKIATTSAIKPDIKPSQSNSILLKTNQFKSARVGVNRLQCNQFPQSVCVTIWEFKLNDNTWSVFPIKIWRVI